MDLWQPNKGIRSAINRGEKKFREWRQRIAEQAEREWYEHRYRSALGQARTRDGQLANTARTGMEGNPPWDES